MKLTYSIAILLSVTFVQSISAASAIAEKPEAMAFKRREMPLHDSRSLHVATALRRRAKYLSPLLVRRNNDEYFYQPTTGADSGETSASERNNGYSNSSNNRFAPGPVNTVDSTLSKISSTVKLLLASDDESNNSDGGKEEKNNNGDEEKYKEKARKELIKLVKDLGKAINKFLKEAGSTSTLDLDDTLKAAEKGRLYSPNTQNKRDIQVQGTGAAKSNQKAQAAAQKVTLAAEQVAGYAAQMEDSDSKSGAALIVEVNVLISLVIQ